ncbi:MAG TPA: nitroreductase family deazaflavin-dependent oxidoreductase [Candidatus Limnocylindria bacterium]|nr:nitroreductase family deazaflavin-dependent oxidoreductase [Candidatus Limnocylindria bacterium]
MSQPAARAPWVVRTFDPLLRNLLARGLRLGPNAILTVTGRKSGEPRSAAVALLEVANRRWILGAYGEVNWVRNLRAAGHGTIRLDGGDVRVRAVALTTAEAEAFFRNELRTYVEALPWFWRRVASIFGGEPLRDPARAALRHPVFELVDVTA